MERFVNPHETKTDRAFAPSFYAEGWINDAHARIVDTVDGVEGRLTVEDHHKLYEAAYHARGNIVEIGRFCGRSTCILGLGMRDSGSDLPIYSIDYSPRDLAVAQQNLRRYDLFDATTLIQGDSATQVSRLPAPFDTVFVDGDHAYEGVRRDIDALLPLVVQGGVLLFHDFYHAGNATGEYGVQRAVEESDGIAFRGRFGAIAVYERLDENTT